MKIFCIFFVAATEKNLTWSFNFQLPQYKRGIIVADTEVIHDPGGFPSDSVRCRDDVMTTLKVWMVQYRDSDIRLISQFDISNIMAISRAMSLRYRYNIKISTGMIQLIWLCKIANSYKLDVQIFIWVLLLELVWRKYTNHISHFEEAQLFTRCSLLVEIHSLLVTRCKIRSLLIATFACYSLQSSFVTRCRSCSLQKFVHCKNTRCSLQNSILTYCI